MTQPFAPTAVMPGWYRDPLNPRLVRYWDSTGWTYWTHELDTSSVPSPADPPGQEPEAEPELRADIAAAAARLGKLGTLGAGKELRHLESHLHPGEEVVEIGVGQALDGSGKVTGGIGVLACTNQRAIFLFVGLLNKTLQEAAWQHVTALGCDPRGRDIHLFEGRITKRSTPTIHVRISDKTAAATLLRAGQQQLDQPRLDTPR